MIFYKCKTCGLIVNDYFKTCSGCGTDSEKETIKLKSENKIDNNEELRIVKNFISKMTKAYRIRNMNWCVVRDILMARTSTSGSNSCISKCICLGIDPYGYKIEEVEDN